MATRIYGSINPDTGQTISTRAVESPYSVPKIDTDMEKENIGFWENTYDWVHRKTALATRAMGGGIQPTTQEVSEGVKSIGSGLLGGLTRVTIIAIIVGAVILVPYFKARA